MVDIPTENNLDDLSSTTDNEQEAMVANPKTLLK
jgi:hypothetical protein